MRTAKWRLHSKPLKFRRSALIVRANDSTDRHLDLIFITPYSLVISAKTILTAVNGLILPIKTVQYMTAILYAVS
jgi:hypothetical protein